METIQFEYPARTPVSGRVHVGVVASGDLELLLQPSHDLLARVQVQTSVGGFASIWKNVLDRFFTRFDGAVRIEINDCGATPGTVRLRLEQAAEALRS